MLFVKKKKKKKMKQVCVDVMCEGDPGLHRKKYLKQVYISIGLYIVR